MKRVKRINRYKGPVNTKNSLRDVKYCIGNVVNNIVIIIYGVRRVLDLLG